MQTPDIILGIVFGPLDRFFELNVLANLVFLPIATKLDFRCKEEALAKQVITEGIISIMQGANPKVLKDKLEAFVPPAMVYMITNPPTSTLV